MSKSDRIASLKVMLPVSISLLGSLLYVVLAWGHAHGQVSVLDEGLYLYKGYRFAAGDYQPFQDYGPLTNHMPLSFLIPGWMQIVFGAGIRTGRYFAIGLGVLMLLGLWLTTRRLAGRWWAVMAIWAVVLNPGLVKIYSQATSQVLVSCMLVWVLYFALGEDRKPWQRLTGVALSGLLLLTRLNLAPVLLLLVIYIFWKSGRKFGNVALLLGLFVVVVGHAAYWPDILKIWAQWIPQSFTRFLDVYRLPADAVPFWDPHIQLVHRLGSLKSSIQLHLISTLGCVGMLTILITHRRSDSLDHKQGPAWFLVILFGTLFILHALASLGMNYCVYCFRNYSAFFTPVGLILFGLMGNELSRVRASRNVYLFMGSLVLIPPALGLPLGNPFIRSILSTDVPRISGSILRPGTLELGVLLTNKFGMEYELLSTIGQILLYSLILLIPMLIQALVRSRKGIELAPPAGSRFFIGVFTFVLIEMFLASTYFGNGYGDYDCGQDVILAHEHVGRELATKLDENSLIYWGTSESPVPLLYLPGREVFPPQLNGDYTFMLRGESEELLRLGYWNRPLANDWMLDADYVLFSEHDYKSLIAAGFEEERYDEIVKTPPTNPCVADSSIMIFKRQ